MVTRAFGLTVRNKPAAIAVAILVLAIGGALLTFGLLLLAGLVVAGGVIGAGLTLYRRLRPGRGHITRSAARAGLDPANEVRLPPGKTP